MNYAGSAPMMEVEGQNEYLDVPFPIESFFLHVSSNVGNHYHSLCEKSPTSWCQYQRDQCNGTNLFKYGPGLHKDIIAAVKPIYKDLIKASNTRNTSKTKRL